MKRKNFPGRKKKRRQTALNNLLKKEKPTPKDKTIIDKLKKRT